MTKRSQLFFVLAALFLVAAIVWFFLQNRIVSIVLLAAALIWLILAIVFRVQEKRKKE